MSRRHSVPPAVSLPPAHSLDRIMRKCQTDPSRGRLDPQRACALQQSQYHERREVGGCLQCQEANTAGQQVGSGSPGWETPRPRRPWDLWGIRMCPVRSGAAVWRRRRSECHSCALLLSETVPLLGRGPRKPGRQGVVVSAKHSQRVQQSCERVCGRVGVRAVHTSV